MSPIYQNSIAQMYGPNFLLFFAVVVAAAMIVCKIYLNSMEPAADPPLIPHAPDPYEIAYLRGGENEVIRSATVSLLQRGLLAMEVPIAGKSPSKGTRIGWSKYHQPTNTLPPIEHSVYLTFRNERLPSEIFTPTLQSQISGLCADYQERLTARSLLYKPETLRAGKRAVGWTAMAVMALGAYKFMAAIDSGHKNVAFLVIEMLVAAIAFAVQGCSIPRMTSAGKRYVQNMQRAYNGLRQSDVPVTSSQILDPTLMLAAVFGVAALAGTPQEAYGAMFQKAGSTSSSGCGSSSSCGSSCSGGGSCGGGGGCGGCGGG